MQGILAQHADQNRTVHEQVPCQYLSNYTKEKSSSSYYTNDSTYDIRSYHLELKPSLDEPFIKGTIHYMLTIKEDDIKIIRMDLAEELLVTQHSPIVAQTIQQGRVLEVHFNQSYSAGEVLSFWLSYQGETVLLNNIKGLVYKLENPDQPLVVSLSTPYLAHRWWPCKDGPEDKADSIRVDITIPDRTVNGIPVKAVSNGVLKEVVHENDSTTWKWQHSYPIVPYYVMIAVSNYSMFDQQYSSEQYLDFPLEYYVFDDHLQDAMEGVQEMPEVMHFFEEIFGPYPFNREKYGMTQLGFYGGIENQTNSIMNRLSADYFMTSVHELAHMWFGDKLTCRTWHEAWLNEGFASYAESLWIEYRYGKEAYHEYMNSDLYFGDGTLYYEDDTDPFGIFLSIIYTKGSWFLHMLRKLMGDEAFFAALKSYANEPGWAYGNVTEADLLFICEQSCDCELDYFFEQWIRNSGYPQYSYNFIQDANEGNVELFLLQTPMNQAGNQSFFKMPVDILFRFEDGTSDIRTIENKAMYESYVFSFEKSVASVEIDPENWILCKKYRDLSLESFSPIRPSSFQVYPNPVKALSRLTLKTDREVLGMILIGTNGRRSLIHLPTEDFPDGIIRFDLPAGLPPGRYFLQIRTSQDQSFLTDLLISE